MNSNIRLSYSILKNKLAISIFIYFIPFIASLGILNFIIQFPPDIVPYGTVIPQIFLLSLLFSAAYWLFNKQQYSLFVSFLAAILFIIAAWMMNNTVGNLGGTGKDNYFSLAMITTFMNTWKNEDFSFVNLSSFYPYYFHYLSAKIGGLFDLSVQEIFKYSAIITIYLIILLVFLFWRRLVDQQNAFVYLLASLASISLVKVFIKPYEMLTLLLIIPWWIFYLGGVQDKLKNALAGGLIGGILFGIYYYWFFPLVLASIYLLIEKIREKKLNYFLIKYYTIFLLCFFIAASAYLFPYLYEMMRFGAEPFQNRWLNVKHLDFPLLHLENYKDLTLLIGLFYLIFRVNNPINKHLLAILISSYIWILLGSIGIIYDTPLLHIKIYFLIELLLNLGFFAWILAVARYFKIKEKIAHFILLIYALNPLFNEIIQEQDSAVKKAAFLILEKKFAQNPDLIHLLEKKNILATKERMHALNPFIYLHFFTENSHYAHPASLISQRLDFLNLLAQSNNQQLTTWMLRHNRFSSIDYLWLDKGVFRTRHDNFPNGLKVVAIQFSPEFFIPLEQIIAFPGLYKVPEKLDQPDLTNLSDSDKTLYTRFSEKSSVFR